MTPHDWNAEDYDRTNAGVIALGAEVLDRLELRGDETVLDAGCGTGALTERLIERLPNGKVIGLDASPKMIEFARERLGDRAELIQADLASFVLGDRTVDAVFSTATFHWVDDHDNLFRRLRHATVGGGRLVAQCGGYGNIAACRTATAEVAAMEPFRGNMPVLDPWNFAKPDETERRLAAAGYSAAKCWLEERPVFPDDPGKHLREVILGAHLQAMPEELREPFAKQVHDRLGDFTMVDYVRLNIDATA
jgi:trans-aconitate 2-methyltransferase